MITNSCHAVLLPPCRRVQSSQRWTLAPLPRVGVFLRRHRRTPRSVDPSLGMMTCGHHGHRPGTSRWGQRHHGNPFIRQRHIGVVSRSLILCKGGPQKAVGFRRAQLSCKCETDLSSIVSCSSIQSRQCLPLFLIQLNARFAPDCNVIGSVECVAPPDRGHAIANILRLRV